MNLLKRYINNIISNFYTCIESVAKCFKPKNTNKPLIKPLYSCIIITTNKLYQCYNYQLTYHNNMRYVYFDVDDILKDCWYNKYNMKVEIRKLYPTELQIAYFDIDFSNSICEETIIDNKKIHEIYINNNENSVDNKDNINNLVIRLPINRNEPGGKFVYIFNRK